MLLDTSNNLTKSKQNLSILIGLLFSAALLLPTRSYADLSCYDLFSLAKQSGIWESSQTIRLGLNSDFNQIVNKIEPHFPSSGLEASDKKNAYTPTQLSIGNLRVQVLARGNGSTSAYSDEANFPKLKIRIPTKEVEGTPLEGIPEFYINTHLHTEPKEKWSPMGRLIDGNSPFREALAYDIAKALGIETGGYRRAKITYEDSKTGQKFERQALLIESHQAVAKRLKSSELDIGDFMNLPKPSSENLAAAIRVHLFQNLIGNQDFGFDYLRKGSPTMKFQPLKNMVALRRPGNKITPVVYDFDVATLVTGYESLYPWQSQPDFGYPDRSFAFSMRYMLRLRTEFYETDLRPELNHVLNEIPKLQRLIKAADVDQAGKLNALAHLNNFAKAAVAMYDPALLFIQGKKVQLYEKPNGRKSKMAISAISGRRGYLRPGTPIRILEEAGDYLKVAIFDLHFDLEDNSNVIGYIKKDSQFGATVLQDNLPVDDERDRY